MAIGIRSLSHSLNIVVPVYHLQTWELPLVKAKEGPRKESWLRGHAPWCCQRDAGTEGCLDLRLAELEVVRTDKKNKQSVRTQWNWRATVSIIYDLFPEFHYKTLMKEFNKPFLIGDVGWTLGSHYWVWVLSTLLSIFLPSHRAFLWREKVYTLGVMSQDNNLMLYVRLREVGRLTDHSQDLT